ncbi:hypothetical protein [Staphylococcus auricularis]|nr:hypothetical protein [Staphylococcus auricularis]
MKKVENVRREFVGNVCEELKRGISCIKGFGERVLEGGKEDRE